MTAFRVPAALKDTAIRNRLVNGSASPRRRPGQAQRADRPVGHMGYMRRARRRRGLAALELVLEDLGLESSPVVPSLPRSRCCWDASDRGRPVSSGRFQQARTTFEQFDFGVDADLLDGACTRAESSTGDRQIGRRRPGDPAAAEPDLEVVVNTKLDAPALRGRRWRSRRDRDPIRDAADGRGPKDQPRLKAIVRAGVGVDNIDVAAATRQGIVVMNTPGGNTICTAEHTISSDARPVAHNVGQANASLKAGKWDRTKFTGTQLGARRWASSAWAASASQSPSGPRGST